MNPLISFETPKGYVLQGAWLGKPRAKTVYIFLHGLTGNLFSRADIGAELAKSPGTAALMFNNRGHDHVTKLRCTGKKQSILAGSAHEVFSDSRDDIAGAVAFAKSRGAKRIILVGHSTGCQKAVWYLAGRPAREVLGAVLLAPLSDYSGAKALFGTRYESIKKAAQKLVASGKAHTMLPEAFSHVPCDAQRWLSLYTPESEEEIFTYVSGKVPTALRKTKVPLLALFAATDEYADRPAQQLAAWFKSARPQQPIDARVVDAPNHAFSGKSKLIAKLVSDWTNAIR